MDHTHNTTSNTTSGGGAGGAHTVSYSAEKVIGTGSFGVVFLAKVVESEELVAIKKVLQDKRFRNRELQILRQMSHTNIISMKHCFYSNGEKPDELYLNIVTDFLPDTVYRFSRMFTRQKEYMPPLYAKLFIYQMIRSLSYLHNPKLNIAHRDVKPQNLLIDPATGVLKLCDFGSAKGLTDGDNNVSYICSRYYRAPELIFGNTNYTTAVDIWGAGCVAAELFLGQPLFPGESSLDQMVEIIKVLGTPTPEEVEALNKNYQDHKFPAIRALPWNRVFRSHTPPEAIDLISQMLQYRPGDRILMLDALSHPLFDELRDPATSMPNGKPLPPLFDYSDEEREYIPQPVLAKLIPFHARDGML